MSNRVRLLARHADYGSFKNQYAIIQMEATQANFQSRFPSKFAVIEHMRPVEFATWPRWKRATYMGRRTGWNIFICREPRRTRKQQSHTNKHIATYGMYWQNLKGKYAPVPQKKKAKKLLFNPDLLRAAGEVPRQRERFRVEFQNGRPRFRTVAQDLADVLGQQQGRAEAAPAPAPDIHNWARPVQQVVDEAQVAIDMEAVENELRNAFREDNEPGVPF